MKPILGRAFKDFIGLRAFIRVRSASATGSMSNGNYQFYLRPKSTIANFESDIGEEGTFVSGDSPHSGSTVAQG